MTDLHPSPESDRVAVAEEPAEVTRRFRASTYEGAVAAATAELGPEIRVVAANRIRRGGLGGFFATDLGVEIAVVADPTRDAAADAWATVDRQSFFDPRSAGDRSAGDRANGDRVVGTSGSAPAELEAVEEVLSLSDDGLESLLREVEHSGSRNAMPPTGSAAAALSTFADHLAREGGPSAPVMPGTAPTDGWADSPDATMATLPSVAEELRRQADEVSRQERLGGSAMTEAVDQTAIGRSPEVDAPSDAAVPSEHAGPSDAALSREVAPALESDASTADDEFVPMLPMSSIDVEPAREIDQSARAAAIDDVAALDELLPLDELAAISEIPVIDQIPLIDEANRPETDCGVGEPILPDRVITGAAASQGDDDADWKRVLEVQQEAAMRQEARRQDEARASLRREREMTFQTVVARRALVDRELAARVSSEYLGLVGAAAPMVNPARIPDPAVVETIAPMAAASSADSALADLDELLRRAGVRVPDEAEYLTDGAGRPGRTNTTELATNATDHLVSRLADIVAVDGSPLDDLTRVSVAVTTPDGVMIEMVADVDA